uniref:Neuferricin n=1 Tax=Sphenodon punctatus TaxID=8508 RepID=A0A8D0GNL6_SPHPU
MLRGALAAVGLGLAAAWLLGDGGFDPRTWFLSSSRNRLLRPGELSRYTGMPGSAGLYLAVLGRVFDVQRGHRHYGPGGAYSSFSGKDASRAFVTGDFTEAGLVDDVSGLSPSEMLTIQNWLSFYNKNYILVGKVIGRFYDEHGAPTRALKQAEADIEEGLKLKAEGDEMKKQFPPCNSEWSSTSGSRVWCSKESGGVKREWTGVPRQLYKPGSRSSQCVCVRTTGLPSAQSDSGKHRTRSDLDSPNLQEYEGCHPLADWCVLKA